MATPTVIPNLQLLQPPACEHSPRPWASSLYCFHKDLKTATTDPDNPTGTAIEDSANAALHQILTNPGAFFLDAFAVISGATSPSGSVKLRAFGWVPWTKNAAGQHAPGAIDPTNFDHPGVATLLGPGGVNGEWGLWVPLFRPTDGAHELELNTTPECDKDELTGSTKRLKLIGSSLMSTIQDVAYWDCAGTTLNLITVSQAMTGPTAALGLARYRI